jgi:hypothetical protein
MRREIPILTTFYRCGGDIRKPLSNIRPHIAHFAEEADAIIRQRRKRRIGTLSPYIGRGLLEASF